MADQNEYVYVVVNCFKVSTFSEDSQDKNYKTEGVCGCELLQSQYI